jgi:hypothetical protein
MATTTTATLSAHRKRDCDGKRSYREALHVEIVRLLRKRRCHRNVSTLALLSV